MSLPHASIFGGGLWERPVGIVQQILGEVLERLYSIYEDLLTELCSNLNVSRRLWLKNLNRKFTKSAWVVFKNKKNADEGAWAKPLSYAKMK